ncbi:kelch-like protein 3 [Montipora foliosa]|uniref:kelch-like protein 3 n=1 Tax=Montipora foliosa TaxID=591990 RepID=UPI0035F1EBDD
MVAHSEILLSKCALFREQGEFIDVRLKVGDDEFPAHRIVLAANSDYFHAMFAHGMKESNQEVIELKDENISAAALKIVMDSIYGGEISINDENVFEVLLAADHLQVTSVIQQCCDYLQTEFVHQKFDLQTYGRICRIVDRLGLKELKEATQHEMALIYKEICESEEFLAHFDADQLSSLLSRDDLNAPSENFVFKSVMQWIKYKKEERMPVAAKVIGAVRLGLVDIKDVIEELDTEEMQVIPEIHTLLHRTLIHNYRPSNRSTFSLEKAKPRSMSPVLVAILPMSEIKYFDIMSKTWQPLPSMPQLTKVKGCCCAQYAGNYLYVAAKSINTIYCYDIVHNTWGTLPPLPDSVNQIGCLCYFEDHIYVIYQYSAPYRYNVATNHWQSFTCSNAKHYNLGPKTFSNEAGVVYKSCLYVLYGQGRSYFEPGSRWRSSEAFSSVLFCFDPKRNAWEQKASTTTPHFGSSLLVVKNKLYVAGGTCSVCPNDPSEPTGSAAAIEVYDEQANTWSVVQQTHIPPNNLGAVEVGGRVFFIINCFPVYSGITISPGEVYPVVLDGWEDLGKVDKSAVLCYVPIKMENLTAENT